MVVSRIALLLVGFMVSGVMFSQSAIHAALITAVTTARTTGNQSVGVEVGQTFRVLSTIVISELGTFDDGGNGLSASITVRLWNATATTTSGAGDPVPAGNDIIATAGTLITSTVLDGTNGSGSPYVFEAITPVVLTPGTYVISSSGYGVSELLGNSSLAGVEGTAVDGNGGTLIRYGANQFHSTSAGLFPGTWQDYYSTDQVSLLGPNFRFAPVPEPNALLLAFLGMSGFTINRRRWFRSFTP